jgi:hypothetical protein
MDDIDCFHENIIVTIAIITHGAVINLDLSPQIQSLFENVRIFSKAGDFQKVYADSDDIHYDISRLYSQFRKDIHNTDTLQLLNDYSSKTKEYYSREAENENVCRVFENITVDKLYSVNNLLDSFNVSSVFEFLDSFIRRELSGIFLVSIHKKVNGTYTFIGPVGRHFNLLEIQNLKKMAEMIHPVRNENENERLTKIMDYIDHLHLLGNDVSLFNERKKYQKNLDIIHDSKEYSEEEKTQLIQKEKSNFFHFIQHLKIEIYKNYIYTIRLSLLVHLIKTIVGENCAINFTDYSCNHITTDMPAEYTSYSKFMTPSDIENPPPYSRKWGGKKRKSKKRLLTKKSKKTKKTKKSK